MLYLLVAAVAIFVLFPQLIGFHRAWRLLTTASPLFLVLVLGTETVRYFLSAASTRVLGHLFDRRIPFVPLVGAFFAGAAANRAFSTGGAPGMLIRLLYLTRHGITTGSVAVIFLIEDVAGGIVGITILLVGVLSLLNAHPSDQYLAGMGVIFLLATVLFALGGVYVYRRRAWVQNTVHRIARATSALALWVTGRDYYDASRIDKGVEEFYAGMTIACRAPHLVAAAFALNFLRYVAGAAAFYFAFLSFGWTIPLGGLIMLYTSASVLSTTSAIPGELMLMGGTYAILSLSFGVPHDITMMAMLLARAIAFWLPLPVGFAAFWGLRKQGHL